MTVGRVSLARNLSGLLLAGALLSLSVHAAPTEPPASSDPVMRLLAAQGLISASVTEEGSLLKQVREQASSLVTSAMDFIGVRYRRGGNSANEGFDCSGFTRYIFENSVGLALPRRAAEQATAPGLLQIRQEDLKPGDLVFFNTLKRTFSHVGIYIGDGKFIHAPRTGSAVRVDDMRESYWLSRFNGGRRVPQMVESNPSTGGAGTP